MTHTNGIEKKVLVNPDSTPVMAISSVLSNNRPATLRERVLIDNHITVATDGRVYSVLLFDVKTVWQNVRKKRGATLSAPRFFMRGLVALELVNLCYGQSALILLKSIGCTKEEVI